MNDVAAALADPQAIARETVVAYEHPVLGEVRTVDSPLRFEDSARPPSRVPYLGEQTVEILSGVCGYSEERIGELAALGVFGP